MENKSVKIVFASEPRRVSSAYFDFTNFRQFCSQAKSLFQKDFHGMENGRNFVLKYIDDEGDCITIKSDEELQTSIKSQGDENLLKYQIVEEAQPALPVVEEQTSAREINRIAVAMINEGDLDNARTMLHRGLNRYPRQTTLYYNLACVESLAGDLEASFECLRSSIMYGYYNFDHIMNDSDLTNLRNSPVYNVRSLIAQARQGNVEQQVQETCQEPTKPEEEVQADIAPVEIAADLPINPPEEDVEEMSSESSDSDVEDIVHVEIPLIEIPAPEVPVPEPEVPAQEEGAVVTGPVANIPESARFPYTKELGVLEDMGFQTGKAMQALLKAKGVLNAALEDLF